MLGHKKTIEYNGMTIEVKKKYGLFLLRAGNISLLSDTCNERDFAKLSSLSEKSLSSSSLSIAGGHST